MSGPSEEASRAEAMRLNEYVAQQTKTMSYVFQKKSAVDLNQEIRLIERKIRNCQKKLEEDKRRK